MKSTNYFNTFIEVAADCPANTAEVPPVNKKPTVANIQFEMITNNPYKHTSDDVIFSVHAFKNNIDQKKQKKERQEFFSKGQACMRCSPLAKRYGWGVHSNDKGKIAIYAVESAEYKKFCSDSKLSHTKAMRSKKQ
jgi:hypothetical protein